MRRKGIYIGLAAGILIAGIVWAWTRTREDPQLAEVRVLAKQAFGEEAKDLPEEKRSELRKQFFEANKDLTDVQRRQLMDDRRKEFDQRLDEYFKLSTEERKSFLNAEIDRMQEKTKKMKNISREDREKFRAEREKFRENGNGQPRPPMSTQQRNEMARKMLDSTTPERRAQMAEFFTQMRAAMAARGLPMFGPPGGGGPGFGGPGFGPPPGGGGPPPFGPR